MAYALLRRKADKCSVFGHVSEFGGTAEVHTRCSECGKTLSSSHTLVPLGNDDDEWDCSTSTFRAKLLCQCGYTTYTDWLYGSESVDIVPTCKTEGRYEHVGYYQDGRYACPTWHSLGLDPSNHEGGVTTQTTPATCTATGLETLICNGCNQTISTSILDKNPNNHSGSPVLTDSTTSDHKQYNCCGATYEDSSYCTYSYGGAQWYSDQSRGAYKIGTCACQNTTTMYSSSCVVNDDYPATCSSYRKYDYLATFPDGTTSVSPGWNYGSSYNSSNHEGSEENGGTSTCHTKCSACGGTIKGSSYHSYTVDSGITYTSATCKTKGKNYAKCTCGYNPQSSSYTIDTSLNTSNHENSPTWGGTSSVHRRWSCCGATEGSSYHNYNQTGGGLKSAGTCKTAAVYYYKCICGYNPKSSSYTYTGSKDTTNHENSPTWGGTSSVHRRWSCCGATEGSSYHRYNVKSGVVYTSATCQSYAKYYYSCECGYNPKSSSYLYRGTSYGDHNWSSTDKAKKSVAQTVPEKDRHTGVRCTTSGCNVVCTHGEGYGSWGSVYSEGARGHDQDFSCSRCGFTTTAAQWSYNKTSIPHQYNSSYSRHSDTQHKRKCKECSYYEYSNHYLTSSTSTKCAACGATKPSNVEWQIIN